jgi:ribonuclease III
MSKFWQGLFGTFTSFKNKEEIQSFKKLEAKLDYRFKDKELLKLSLVHRSYLSISGEKRANTNERLEFLGDAVLGFIVTEYLFDVFPEKSEGVLTEYKSILVSRKILGQIGRQIDLGLFLFLGQGEERSGGRKRRSIISNAVEAVLGAVYLDGGYKATMKVIKHLILSQFDQILKSELDRNFKSQLLEAAQANGLGLPEYEVKKERGPEHEKVFEITVRVKGKVLGTGTGKSKKMAEQNAAHQAVDNMNGNSG